MSKRRNPGRTDKDNPEWSAEVFARARPANEVLSEIFEPADAARMLKPESGRPAIAKSPESTTRKN
jgi:hypothetical protein